MDNRKDTAKKGRPEAEWSKGLKMKGVSMRLPAEVWQKFKIKCIEDGVSSTEKIYRLVTDFLSH